MARVRSASAARGAFNAAREHAQLSSDDVLALRLAGAMRERSFLARTLNAEAGRWFAWVPVAVAVGIAMYFALPVEPHWSHAIIALIGAVALRIGVTRGLFTHLFTALLIWAALGFSASVMRTAIIASPVYPASANGFAPAVTITGWLEEIRPLENAKSARLLLRVHTIAGLAEDATPYRIRVRANLGAQGIVRLQTQLGKLISMRAVLYPPAAPVQPHGFDFARRAFFQRLGAVGYVIAPPQPVDGTSKPAEGAQTGQTIQPPLQRPFDVVILEYIERLRLAIGLRIRAHLPGDAGALASALIVGDRSGLSQRALSSLRDSGLAHVLAISGMHMAIIAGTLFWAVRAFLAAVPGLALRFPVRKAAALTALAGATCYLLISGMSIATQRAYIMLALMFVAMLLNRPAVSLRNVALAALLILLAAPESLLEIGFQMSFAAAVALVSVYEALRRRQDESRLKQRASHLSSRLRRHWLGRPLSFSGGIMLTTLIASAAVAPFAILHFHKLAQYSMLGNVIAIPLITLAVMPLAIAVLVTMPVGFDGLPLAAMGWTLEHVLAAAHWVSSLDAAVIRFPSMSHTTFAVIVLGGLWLLLWSTRWRFVGLAVVALAVLTAQPVRPDILIAREGKAVAVRQADGKLLSMPGRGGGYAVRMWLEADGDGRSAREAAGTAKPSPKDEARERNVATKPSVRKVPSAAHLRAMTCDRAGCAAEAYGLNPGDTALRRTLARINHFTAAARNILWPETKSTLTLSSVRDASSQTIDKAASQTTDPEPRNEIHKQQKERKPLQVAIARHPSALQEDCRRADIVVVQFDYAGPCPSAQLMLDRQLLRRNGAHMIHLRNGRIARIDTVAKSRGIRPWTLANRAPLPRRPPGNKQSPKTSE